MLKAIGGLINNRYGSKRGFVRYWRGRAAALAGQYDGLRAVDWDRVERLVFMCTGNICRSPLAAVYAESQGT